MTDANRSTGALPGARLSLTLTPTRSPAGVMALFGCLGLLAGLLAPPPAAADTPLYRDAGAPVAERVADLIDRMTLEEKVAQLNTLWDSKPKVYDEQLNFDPAKMKRLYPHGIGQVARPSDARGAVSPRVLPGRDVAGTIELVNAMQAFAVEQTRLGIPILFHEEGLHGYAAVGATSFPQAIALASTWDPDLVRRVNAVTAREIRARGVHLVLSPVVDIARDPRWGRIEETFGEDPYLVGEMGVAAVEGLQGAGEIDTLAPGKVFATLKHMTGHGQPESGTNAGPAFISERRLRETFFPPFEAVVRRTDIGAVMASYNEIDGVPSHANRWLLTDVLRGEWGFDGVLVSDYYAIDQLVDLHHVAANRADAALLALRAGVDVDLPDGGSYSTLVAAVREGRIEESELDGPLRRFLTLKFRSGLFENPYAGVAGAEALTNNAAARELALEAARRAVVLLRNDGLLPLSLPEAGPGPTIAVIGPNAAVTRLGGYSGQPPETVSLLEGIRARVGDRAGIRHARGVRITADDDWWADEVELADPARNRELIEEAVAVAREADLVILALGDTEQTSREAWADTHLGDRASLQLVGQQQALFDAIHATGKPVAVVLINGRPAATVDIAGKANALIEAWYLGERGGQAMAEVLFGDVNPGGKLPVTVPRHVGQLPLSYDYKPSALRGYLFDTTEPLFPFGHGLSYTTFEIGEPELVRAEVAPGEPVTLRVTVRNTGDRAGDETVQIYVRDRLASVTRPVRALKAFQRVRLAPGEARELRLTLPPEAFELWNTRMERVVEPGEFDILVGPSAADLRAATLTISGGA